MLKFLNAILILNNSQTNKLPTLVTSFNFSKSNHFFCSILGLVGFSDRTNIFNAMEARLQTAT